MEAKINVSCGYANFSPLHLAILHYVIKPTDPLRKDLILELINKGANIATKDQYGHSAKDLLQYKGLGVEDLHLFTINTQELKQALRSEPGPKYSFKELATNKHVVDFFKDKGFTTFEPNWTNTNLFKNFLDEHRQKNGDKYIIDYNDIDERNGPKEDIFAGVVIRTLYFDTDLQELVSSLSKVLYGTDTQDEIEKSASANNILHRSFVDISNNHDSLEFVGKLTELLGEVTVNE